MLNTILLKKLKHCDFCKRTGIWKGEFHSSVCSLCNGLSLVNEDGSVVSFTEAVKLLKTRHNQLKHEFHRIKNLAPQPELADFEVVPNNTLNREYTHDKTPPLFWEPVKYGVCDQCNGSGLYVGIVSTVDCATCGTSAIVGVDSETLEPFEQIAILAMRNKVLKRRIKILRSQEGVEETLAELEELQLRENMRW